MFFKSALSAAILAFVAVTGLPGYATAQETGSGAQMAVIPAVVDIDEIISQSLAMKQIHEQLSTYQSQLQKRSDAEKEAIQKEEGELMRKRSVMAPEAFAEERKKFQERVVQYQRKAQESTLKLNQVRAKATQQVLKAVDEIIREIVKKNGVTIVYLKKMVYLVDPAMDISQFVIEALNKRMPTVQVEDPTK